jgi:hypothetical protein
LRSIVLRFFCAALLLAAACRRDDPVSILQVTTTASPRVSSIAHDTLGVLVTVQVRNPLDRPVRVVTRPGRFLSRGDANAMLGQSGAKGSWGAGFAVSVGPGRAEGKAGFQNTFKGAPKGRTLTFAPGQTLSDTFRLHFKPDAADHGPDLPPGRFMLVGSWNTNEGPGVEIEVVE